MAINALIKALGAGALVQDWELDPVPRTQPSLKHQYRPELRSGIGACHSNDHSRASARHAASSMPSRLSRSALSKSPAQSFKPPRNHALIGGAKPRLGRSNIASGTYFLSTWRSSHLPCPPRIFMFGRQRPDVIGDTFIQQRRTRFQRDRHRGAVDLNQNIVRQVRQSRPCTSVARTDRTPTAHGSDRLGTGRCDPGPHQLVAAGVGREQEIINAMRASGAARQRVSASAGPAARGAEQAIPLILRERADGISQHAAERSRYKAGAVPEFRHQRVTVIPAKHFIAAVTRERNGHIRPGRI